jgi:multiple sugar transport system permease protein
MAITLEKQKRLIGLLFLLPAVLYLLIFFMYPFVYNLLLGFQNTTLKTYISRTAEFQGFDQYREILQSKIFWRATLNTFQFTVFSIVFQLLIGFLLTLYFQKKFPLAAQMRTLLILPWIIPLMVTANIFKWMISDGGTVNSLLIGYGITFGPVSWLTDRALAMWSVTAINIWLGIPFMFILLYTGLQNIPNEMYEATDIDGANGIQKAWYITIPLLQPVILVCLMLGFVYGFRHFDIVWIVTQGGPGNATHLLSSLAYQKALQEYQFSLGAAISNTMVLVMVFIVFLLSRINSDNT